MKFMQSAMKLSAPALMLTHELTDELKAQLKKGSLGPIEMLQITPGESSVVSYADVLDQKIADAFTGVKLPPPPPAPITIQAAVNALAKAGFGFKNVDTHFEPQMVPTVSLELDCFAPNPSAGYKLVNELIAAIHEVKP